MSVSLFRAPILREWRNAVNMEFAVDAQNRLCNGCAMNAFDKYIRERKLRNPEVAAEIGITEWHVSRLRNGQSPSMPLAKAIKVWSAGAVPIESWDEEAAA